MSRRSCSHWVLQTLGDCPGPGSVMWYERSYWGTGAKGPKPESWDLIVPQPPIHERKAGLWEGAGGWRGQQGVSLISKARVQARPESGPASERGGCAPWPLGSPAGSQESLTEREEGKIAHVYVPQKSPIEVSWTFVEIWIRAKRASVSKKVQKY